MCHRGFNCSKPQIGYKTFIISCTIKSGQKKVVQVSRTIKPIMISHIPFMCVILCKISIQTQDGKSTGGVWTFKIVLNKVRKD